MITRDQALTAQRFHVGECSKVTGPRGGVKISIVECRRNGQTKTWKRTPEAFSIPVKRGLYEHGHITQDNAQRFHVDTDCPIA